MSCDILNAHEWALPNEQYFVSVGFGRDVVVLYQDKGSGPQKYRSIDLSNNAVCIDYSPTETGMIVVGGSEGSLHTMNFYQPAYSASKYQAKYSRPVNSVSLNSSNLAAMGLDRARSEESLLIWDLQSSSTPVISMLPNEAVSCLKFMPSRPTQLLAATYKSIREIDTRTNGKDARLIPTKYSYYVKAHKNNEDLFLSYSESGNMALWDRRKLAPTSQGGFEPVLIVPRVFSESRGKMPRCVQINPTNVGEFGVLNDGEVIRRWHTSITTQNAAPKSALSVAVGEHLEEEEGGKSAVFIDRVVDVRLEHDKVVSFDYVPNPDSSCDFVCIRQSGLVFRTPCKDPMRSLDFTPNDLVCCDSRQIYRLGPQKSTTPKVQPTRLDSHDLLEHFTQHGLVEDMPEDEDMDMPEDEDSASASSVETHIPFTEAVFNDINYIIGQRAELGYGANTEQNIQVLHECSGPLAPDLLQAWKWLSFSHKQDQAGSSHTPQVDLAFAGVYAIWKGFGGFLGQLRFEKGLVQKDYDASIRRLVDKYSERIFVHAHSANPGHRQLCLRAAGWNFEIDELEEKLKDLEAKGQHEKAAGWAVFHGRVERAIQSLAASRKPQLRLMSTAVAGYLLYKDVPNNNAWREQCRRLASELSMPYLRAIFAYISDGSWFDVLDEGSLPVVERLGIALRFLPDNELDRYLERITKRAIKDGDLEGIIMLGQTPQLIDLLQSYVDKTADVQTASVIAVFGCTRFFSDSRVDNWVAAYQHLLNQRKMFSARAVFDVSRNRLAKSRFKNLQQTPIPRQVFLRCLNCKEIFGSRSTKAKDTIRNKNRCTNCNSPLPKCAVCLLPLGPFSREEPPILDKWPTFCMTCSHGSHTQHAREWFERHTVCPVPECQCECGR